ncbi:MAG: ATP-binding cassette domain-containing protein, partial [Steroidobacteraceae bacterium]|nr:ATP-binding cassette domain-containing protein [Steroidobacteraceae bacterium]
MPITTDSTASATPALETVGLHKRYGAVHALRGIDLVVRRGEMFALLGPNGAGKTTLFSILATLLKPSEGEARVLSFDAVRERVQVRQRMGIVFQEPALEGKLSVRDNLYLMGLFYGLSSRAAKTRSLELLGTLDLEEVAGREAQKLSGGQKRRVELARALVATPELLFLDEATLGLDVDARRQFWGEVRRYVGDGGTVFLTTHYMDEAEPADRIALIDHGQIIAIGSPQELKNRVGGGVLLLATDDDERAAQWLRERGHHPEVSERGVLLVEPEPAALLPALLASLPVRTRRAEVHEPSLEDVFLKLTGRALENGAVKAAARG